MRLLMLSLILKSFATELQAYSDKQDYCYLNIIRPVLYILLYFLSFSYIL